MKRILKILVIIAISIYFIGNVLPNLIGVPWAAYNSYTEWKQVEAGQPINHDHFHEEENEEEETIEKPTDSIQVKKEDETITHD